MDFQICTVITCLHASIPKAYNIVSYNVLSGNTGWVYFRHDVRLQFVMVLWILDV